MMSLAVRQALWHNTGRLNRRPRRAPPRPSSTGRASGRGSSPPAAEQGALETRRRATVTTERNDSADKNKLALDVGTPIGS